MFKFEIVPLSEKTEKNSGSFLQTPFWTSFKTRHGWKKYDFSVKTEYPEEDFPECKNSSQETLKKTLERFEVTVLVRSFCKNKFALSYIPLMPPLPFKNSSEDVLDCVLSFSNENEAVLLNQPCTNESQTIEFANFLNDFALSLKKVLPKNVIALSFDPDVIFSSPEERDLFNYGMKVVCFSDKLKLKKKSHDIQPPDSTQIDLTLKEDEILSKMHSKWRYNIRLSEKKGVVVKKYSGMDENISEKIDVFYKLTKETNERDGNSSHAKEYYFDLILSAKEFLHDKESGPQVFLYIAESEGEEIASIMVLFSKTESIYLYGASSNKKRNLMPNHLLQWNAIKDAKAYGSLYYDMYGMPPEGKNENHPMHGLYMFKSNFGGKNIHRTGTWDFPFSPLYGFYSLLEKMRFFYFRKVKKIKKRR